MKSTRQNVCHLRKFKKDGQKEASLKFNLDFTALAVTNIAFTQAVTNITLTQEVTNITLTQAVG